MKRVFYIISIAMMIFAFTSCEQTVDIEESPIKGKWEGGVKNVPMTLTFGQKDVEYECYAEVYDSRATYFGEYSVKDKAITLNFSSIKTNKSAYPKTGYMAPEEMPKEALLYGDTAIIYLGYTFKRK